MLLYFVVYFKNKSFHTLHLVKNESEESAVTEIGAEVIDVIE